MILIMINLITLGFIVVPTGTETVKEPSEISYRDLYERYQTSLSCPCKRIANYYRDFVEISITYHPVCKSWLISNEWIDQLFNPNLTIFESNDFRLTAGSYFQLLAALCSITSRSVQYAINDLLSRVLLTKYLISQTSIKIQIEEEISFTLNSAANSIRQQHEYIRKITHSNQFESALKTPKTFVFNYMLPGNPAGKGLHFYPRIIYTNDSMTCNCIESSTCSTQAAYLNINHTGYVLSSNKNKCVDEIKADLSCRQ